MRLALTAILCTFFTATAVAEPAPPGYSPFDLAQQAKLRADLGTWNCVNVPATKLRSRLLSRSRETGLSRARPATTRLLATNVGAIR